MVYLDQGGASHYPSAGELVISRIGKKSVSSKPGNGRPCASPRKGRLIRALIEGAQKEGDSTVLRATKEKKTCQGNNPGYMCRVDGQEGGVMDG